MLLKHMTKIQGCTTTSLPKVDHADAAHRRADVRDRPSDMRCADDCAEVRRAHGILQATGRGHKACWHQATGDKCRRDQERGVEDQGQAIKRLAHEVHLILVDEDTTGICPYQEGQDQRAGLLQRLRAVLTLLVALEPEGHVGCTACHMGCVEHPALESNGVGSARACSQAPAKARHPEFRSLKALPDGRGSLTDPHCGARLSRQARRGEWCLLLRKSLRHPAWRLSNRSCLSQSYAAL